MEQNSTNYSKEEREEFFRKLRDDYSIFNDTRLEDIQKPLNSTPPHLERLLKVIDGSDMRLQKKTLVY